MSQQANIELVDTIPSKNPSAGPVLTCWLRTTDWPVGQQAGEIFEICQQVNLLVNEAKLTNRSGPLVNKWPIHKFQILTYWLHIRHSRHLHLHYCCLHCHLHNPHAQVYCPRHLHSRCHHYRCHHHLHCLSFIHEDEVWRSIRTAQ